MKKLMEDRVSDENKACSEKNPPKEIWREKPGDFYSDSIEIYDDKPVMRIDCGGIVITQTVRLWHGESERLSEVGALLVEEKAAREEAEDKVAKRDERIISLMDEMTLDRRRAKPYEYKTLFGIKLDAYKDFLDKMEQELGELPREILEDRIKFKAAWEAAEQRAALQKDEIAVLEKKIQKFNDELVEALEASMLEKPAAVGGIKVYGGGIVQCVKNMRDHIVKIEKARDVAYVLNDQEVTRAQAAEKRYADLEAKLDQAVAPRPDAGGNGG